MTPPAARPLDSASAPPLDKSGRTIRDMFAGVAPRYDFLNHLLSAALDHGWRRCAARALGLPAGARVLDLCAGTGDQAVAVGKRGPRVAAADFCLPMIARARGKFARLARRRRGGRAVPLVADALALPFPAAAFDGATAAFGLRNVADLDAALAGLHAALAPGGRLAVLEFAVPRAPWVRGPYLFYFRRVLPAIARRLSPRASAYCYLPASVLDFPQREGFLASLGRAGFGACGWRDLALGAVCLYTATKPREETA